MSGAHCSVVNCGTSRRQKNVEIFSLSSNPDHSEWRKQILHFISRGRQIDADFKRQVDQNKFQIYQKHFDESQYEHVRNLYIMCVNINRCIPWFHLVNIAIFEFLQFESCQKYFSNFYSQTFPFKFNYCISLWHFSVYTKFTISLINQYVQVILIGT